MSAPKISLSLLRFWFATCIVKFPGGERKCLRPGGETMRKNHSLVACVNSPAYNYRTFPAIFLFLIWAAAREPCRRKHQRLLSSFLQLDAVLNIRQLVLNLHVTQNRLEERKTERPFIHAAHPRSFFTCLERHQLLLTDKIPCMPPHGLAQFHSSCRQHVIDSVCFREVLLQYYVPSNRRSSGSLNARGTLAAGFRATNCVCCQT